MTHVAATLAVGLPVIVATDSVSAGSVIALGLGSLFPDIDEPHSWIGRRTRGISDGTKAVFGHRGITHSLIGLFGFVLLSLIITYIFSWPITIVIFFALGYILHLVEDSFSKSGVAWLQPFNKRKYQSGFGVVYYTTGSVVEILLFLIFAVILIFQVKAIDFSPSITAIAAQFDEIKEILFQKLEDIVSWLLNVV